MDSKNGTPRADEHTAQDKTSTLKKAGAAIFLVAFVIYYFLPSSEEITPFELKAPPKGMEHEPGESSTAKYNKVQSEWEQLLLKQAQQEDKTVLAPPPPWSKAQPVALATTNDTLAPLLGSAIGMPPLPDEPDTTDIDIPQDQVTLLDSGQDQNERHTFEPTLGYFDDPPPSAEPAAAVANQPPANHPVSEDELQKEALAISEMVKELTGKHYQVSGHTTASVSTASSSGTSSKQASDLFAAHGQLEIVSPGDMYLCKFDMQIDSRMPKTVVGSCLEGPIRGATITGNFKQFDVNLTYQFNTLSLNGKTIAIEAFAVNPKDYSPGLASEVDRHLVIRTAGLFASSFLEGIGALAMASGTVVSTPASTVIEKTFDGKQVVAAGLGKFGERTAPKAEAWFDTPPTVKQYKDKPFGLVFTKPILQSELPAEMDAAKK